MAAGTEAAPSEAELDRSCATSPAPRSSPPSGSTSPSIRPGSRVTPLTPEARELFAAYVTCLKQQLPSIKDVIIGNEPNINRFWLPQFNPNGTDAAAPAYTALLARSYDAIKAVDPATRVWGGALAPRGVDRPGTGRDTHSPVAFLKDMGIAYRASGRSSADHGRARVPSRTPTRSGQSPDTPHPNSTTIGLADYDRLMRTLATAFDNSPQAGSLLPVLYDEFGVESKIPAGKANALHGRGAGDDEAGRRDHPGRVLREGAPARVLPAERDGDLRLPLAGRARRSRTGSRASTTRTGRRSRASTPSATRSAAPAAARSRAATGSGSTSTPTKVSFPTQAALATRRPHRSLHLLARLHLGAARRRAPRTGATRFRMVGYGRADAGDRRLAEGTQARHAARCASRSRSPTR